MTLTLAAAVLLAVLGTLTRFGSLRPGERVIAFGKAALIDNTAALVRRAGREARLRGGALDAYLDRLGHGPPFTSFAAAAKEAATKAELVGAARALHDWKEARGRRR